MTILNFQAFSRTSHSLEACSPNQGSKKEKKKKKGLQSKAAKVTKLNNYFSLTFSYLAEVLLKLYHTFSISSKCQQFCLLRYLLLSLS